MAKILIVDDNPSILQLLSDFFGNLKGHTVYLAGDADEAIRLTREHLPDLALCDIMMPGTHGVDALLMMKQVSADIRVIMITAVDDEEIAREAMARGAVDYVTKPLDLNYLDTLVTFQLTEQEGG